MLCDEGERETDRERESEGKIFTTGYKSATSFEAPGVAGLKCQVE